MPPPEKAAPARGWLRLTTLEDRRTPRHNSCKPQSLGPQPPGCRGLSCLLLCEPFADPSADSLWIEQFGRGLLGRRRFSLRLWSVRVLGRCLAWSIDPFP